MSHHAFEHRPFDDHHVKARRPSFDFPLDIPKHWLAGNATRTHLMNALNLCMPSYERMVTRFMRDQVLPLLTDPHLRAQARGFLGQEAQHAGVHDKFGANLRAQGYDVTAYQRCCAWVCEQVLERKIGVKLNLAHIAAFEHYVEVLVWLLVESDFFDGCDPRMKAFYEWHAAEEIEHHTVLHDVLIAVDDSYLLRMAGSVLGLLVVLGMLLSSAVVLLRQDGALFSRKTARELVEVLFGKYGVAGRLARLFWQYARRDHRPEIGDNGAFARAVLG
jgi:hypothetical protein